jgi:hypothetical protein
MGTATTYIVIDCKAPACDARGTPEQFPTTKYCSRDCETRHAGRKLLDELVHDHTLCGFCFQRLKEIQPPPSETFWSGDQYQVREAFIGYQFRTPIADIGERELRDDTVPPHIGTGTVCGECGTTDPNDPRPWSEHDDLDAVARRAVAALNRRDDERELDADAIAERAVETGDLALAVGEYAD